MASDRSELVEAMRARFVVALKPLVVEIEDDSARHAGHAGAASGGGHFNVRLVSAAFAGRTRVERHRLVYDQLADLMKRDVHALSMVLLAPDEVPPAHSAAAPPGDPDHL